MPNYYLQIYFDADGQGFSEGYYMRATDQPTAKTDAATIIAARRAMFYLGYAIVYARISDLQIERDAYPIGNGDQLGLLTGGKVNKVSDCMLIRGQHPSPPGGHNNMFWHLVPDASIVDNAYFPTGDAAYDTALAAYIVVLQSLTGWTPKKKKQSQKPAVQAYDSIIIRKITSRKVGLPFGMERGRRPRRR